MALKLYYDILTTQFLYKDEEESWEQGDANLNIELYFGEDDGSNSISGFTNSLTNTTIYNYQAKATFTRPDDEVATLSATQMEDGTEGYYKISTSGDDWLTDEDGTLNIVAQRYDSSDTFTYGLATKEIGEGTPTGSTDYVTQTELDAVEAKVDANTTGKYNKSAINTTTAEGTATVNTSVDSSLKTDEKIDDAISDIQDGTTEIEELNLGGAPITYDESCRVVEVDLGNDVTLQIGEENYICATNKSGSEVTTPTVCEITGSTGNKVQFEVASNDGSPTGNIGLATETIANNSNGKLTHFGLIRNVDTTAIAGSPIEGAVIYLGTNGGLTTVKPTAPNAIIRIGNIVTANASVGVIFVDIQRAGKFANQSDVYFNGGLSNEDVPVYNSANTRWEAVNVDDLTVGQATADGSGHVITTTYATKTELEQL